MSEKEPQGKAKGPEAKPKEATEAAEAKQHGDDGGSTPSTGAPEPGKPADDKTGEQDQPKTPARRRRSAETTTGAAKRPAPRRSADGAVVVRARAKYVRSAPRKARLVMDHIRGKSVEDAVALLSHTPRAASRDVLKLLNSAVANAESNYELAADELRIDRAYVDEGPTIKRYRPRALGRATRINKRTSHMTITLTTSGDKAD
jgi:large subunit ribosomal protein L22